MESDFYVCAIALSKVFAFQCAAGRALIEHFGNPEEVFSAGSRRLREALGAGSAELIDKLSDRQLLAWAREELQWNNRYGIRPLYYESDGYPRRLKECPDAPIILYVKGEANLDAERMLAVVGTRRASYYGRTTCRLIVANLARNPRPPVIVSGLAYGIDAAAHEAALEAGIPTIAAIPGSLDQISPPGHRDLAKQILERGGALVTDFARGDGYSPVQFLRRNRLIAGLSDATLLVESFAKGGGLLTTGLANSYGREVFALPGRSTDAGSEGCNRLIANNQARLVNGAADLEAAMNWEPPRRRKAVQRTLDFGDDPLRRAIGVILAERSPIGFSALLDVLREQLAAAHTPPAAIPDAAALSALLVELEIEGKITALPGDRYSQGIVTFA